MKIDAFGLDIGTTMIKAVYIKRDKEHMQLLAQASAPTPPKALLSDAAADQAKVVEVLRTVLTESNMPTKSVTVALGDNQVFTKVLELPLLSEKELSSAIYWEAEQYIPVPLSTITLDWQILRQDDPSQVDPKMFVLLVGAEISIVKRYQTVLELAGLSIASIETETLSIIRALTGQMNTLTALTINIGANNTSLAILRNGVLIFTYTIPLSGNAFNRAIATEFGFSLDQAEQYKRTYGLTDKTIGEKVGRAIEPILTSILTEVKKALTFYNERYKEQYPISQILLSGGTSKMPGMDLFFAQNCGIETVVINPWSVNNIENVPKEVMDRGPEYAVAVGLALKDYEE